ncbi:IS5 family transposase [Bradyrhizobium glycinis]|uniref:IS5 family transposase n=1 Tax=Bradyrhizobium glycinis TaxID=2751812 RepID=UPI00289C0710|nr:IS5 family transposase [Bradyrhizobium glycinis]
MCQRYGPYTTAYNRFNRWRKAGIWDRLMDAFVKAHDGKVQMIDSSVVRVHQHASGVKKSGDRCVGRSRGGLTTKIHARVDAKGRPVRLMITPGEAHDVTCAEAPARRTRCARHRHRRQRLRCRWGSCPHPRSRCDPQHPHQIQPEEEVPVEKAIYRERNHVERFFNKLKQFRRIATRYDKLGATFFAFVQLASVRIWLRSIESTP